MPTPVQSVTGLTAYLKPVPVPAAPFQLVPAAPVLPVAAAPGLPVSLLAVPVPPITGPAICQSASVLTSDSLSAVHPESTAPLFAAQPDPDDPLLAAQPDSANPLPAVLSDSSYPLPAA